MRVVDRQKETPVRPVAPTKSDQPIAAVLQVKGSRGEAYLPGTASATDSQLLLAGKQ